MRCRLTTDKIDFSSPVYGSASTTHNTLRLSVKRWRFHT
jgi:hypothetical protein